MDTIQEYLKNIREQFRLNMNGPVSQSMREKGIVYKVNYGVGLATIRAIASGLAKDHRLAQALWKEDIRECKILAGLLQPVEAFYPEIADIWMDDIRNIELAEMTSMNLFRHLPYAPAKSFQWIASDNEFVQVCGFLTISWLLAEKGDMDERTACEFLDQAICAALSDSFHARNSAMNAIRKFLLSSPNNAFRVCRMTEKYANPDNEKEEALFNMVKEEIEAQ